MADTEGHIGTLLANLQSMRHLTTLEMRLLQIQDEYQLLREFTSSKPDENPQDDMRELIGHLRDQLVVNQVPIPDALGLDSQQAAFGLELLTKQFEELVAHLKDKDADNKTKLSSLKRLDELVFTETSAASVCSLGVVELAVKALEASLTHPTSKAWARTLAILSAYPVVHNHSSKEDIISLAVSLVMGRDLTMQELGVWILANLSDNPSPEEQAELGQKILVTLVPLLKTPKSDTVLLHSLRCLTNLATNATNRKVIDAWIGVDLISMQLDSPIEAIRFQALWCLSHMASEQLQSSFERSTQLLKRVCHSLKTGTAEPNFLASAWRFVANLSSMPTLRGIMMNHEIFDAAQKVINAELEEIETDQERDLSMIHEAVAFVTNMIAREESLRDAVSAPLLHNFMRLLSSNSAATRAQSAWALSYMSTSDKNHIRILAEGGLEYALELLEGEEEETHAAAWLICNLAANPELHEKLRDNGAIISLVKLLFSKSQDIRLVAGKALSRLSSTSKNQTLVRQLFSTLSLKDDVLGTKTTHT